MVITVGIQVIYLIASEFKDLHFFAFVVLIQGIQQSEKSFNGTRLFIVFIYRITSNLTDTRKIIILANVRYN